MVEAGNVLLVPVILQSLQLHVAIPGVCFGFCLVGFYFLFFLFFSSLDEFSSQTGTSGQSRSARSGVLGVELAKAN